MLSEVFDGDVFHSGSHVSFLLAPSDPTTVCGAIEVKAAERVTDRMMKGEAALRCIVSHKPQPWRTDNGIEVLPVEDYLRRLWEDDLY